MKEKIIIKRQEEILFQGKILNIPLKEASVVEKSIEIFGDEDPCVIHQSFVVKELVTDLLDLFEDNDTDLLNGKDYLEELDFLNFEDIPSITLEIVRKKRWKYI